MLYLITHFLWTLEYGIFILWLHCQEVQIYGTEYFSNVPAIVTGAYVVKLQKWTVKFRIILSRPLNLLIDYVTQNRLNIFLSLNPFTFIFENIFFYAWYYSNISCEDNVNMARNNSTEHWSNGRYISDYCRRRWMGIGIGNDSHARYCSEDQRLSKHIHHRASFRPL